MRRLESQWARRIESAPRHVGRTRPSRMGAGASETHEHDRAPRWTAMSRIALALTLTVTAAIPARADVIDRILAVVGRELITLSDVTAALKLGLVPPPPAWRRRGSRHPRCADCASARTVEANRYQPPEPPAADSRRGSTRSGAAPVTRGVVTRHWRSLGCRRNSCGSRLRDDLRIEAFPRAALRLGPPALRPGAPGVLPDASGRLRTSRRRVRPFSDVRDAIRTQLAATQRATPINEWLDGLRRRTEIADLYVAAAVAPAQELGEIPQTVARFGLFILTVARTIARIGRCRDRSGWRDGRRDRGP